MAAVLPKLKLKQGREKSLRRRHPWIFSGRGRGPRRQPGCRGVDRDRGGRRGGSRPRRLLPGLADPRPCLDVRSGREHRRRVLPAPLGSRRRIAAAPRHARPAGGVPPRVRGIGRPAGAHCGPLRRLSRLPVPVGRCGGVAGDASSSCWRSSAAPRGIYERSEGGARHKEGLPSRRGVLVGSEPPREVEVDGGRRAPRRGHRERPKDGRVSRPTTQSRARRRACPRRRRPRRVLRTPAASRSQVCGAAPRARRSSIPRPKRSHWRSAIRRRTALRERCRFVAANVFDELRTLRDTGARFDVVVLDPPKFVHSADQVNAGSPRLQRHQHAGARARSAGRRACDVLVLGPRRRGVVPEDRGGCRPRRAALGADPRAPCPTGRSSRRDRVSRGGVSQGLDLAGPLTLQCRDTFELDRLLCNKTLWRAGTTITHSVKINAAPASARRSS